MPLFALMVMRVLAKRLRRQNKASDPPRPRRPGRAGRLVGSGEFDAERRTTRPFTEHENVRVQIAAMPAQTFAGMMAKLALAAADFADVDLTRCGGSSEDILASVAVDFTCGRFPGQVRSMAQGIKTGGRKKGLAEQEDASLRAKTAENVFRD